jgi:hypothetical protein
MRRVIFAPSAFRHGLAEEDFFALLAGRYLKVRSQRGIEDVYELLGQTSEGSYLHVVYRVIEGGRLRVFHMAPMTDRQKRRFRRTRR